MGYILVPKQILILGCIEINVNYNTVCKILSGIAPLPLRRTVEQKKSYGHVVKTQLVTFNVKCTRRLIVCV
jgi:hypothetical protein